MPFRQGVCVMLAIGSHCGELCWCVVQYVPYVRDSKRAMDEYVSEIFMGGRSTIAIHNTCEDSLLASPIILDLVILAELLSRIQFQREGESAGALPPITRLVHTCPAQQLCVLQEVSICWSCMCALHCTREVQQ